MLKSNDRFEVEWEDPADADLTWSWDQIHTPRPLSPLGLDVSAAIQANVFPGRQIVVNGYPYRARQWPPISALPDLPEGRTAAQVWQEEYLPEIKAGYARTLGADYAAMSVVTAADTLDEKLEEAGRHFAKSMEVVFMGFGAPAGQLMDFCEHEFGSAGALLGATMLQGIENESSLSGLRLSQLAELAAELPEVASAIKKGRFDDIGQALGGQRWLEEFGAYLSDYGWRAQTWSDIRAPTWAEDPKLPMSLIQRYLVDPEHAPTVAQARARVQREATIRDIEERILDQGKRAKFRSLLEAAQAHIPTSESRANWQNRIVGVLRRPIMALGRKFAEAGILEQAEDIFYVNLVELRGLAHGGNPEGIRAAIAQRRIDLEHWELLVPPATLGRRSGPGRPSGPDRYGGGGFQVSDEPKTVNGNAASQGTARGRARVILKLDDAIRLETGDVLVCPSTAPTWTPLFAIAAAVVTDAGGMLSHSAILAREYAIPCVAGTGIGTQEIPDGAMVVVDGSLGIVHIEE